MPQHPPIWRLARSYLSKEKLSSVRLKKLCKGNLCRFKNSPSGEPGAGLRHLGPAVGGVGLSSQG
jgi:hypothetical protein